MANDGRRRDELDEKLDSLAEDPASKSEQHAMCYSVAVRPTTHEHVCGVCGERTQYPLLVDLGTARGLAARLPSLAGWTLKIDDREFCRSCTPTAPERPAAVLVASRGGTETRIREVTFDDLEALRAYGARWLTSLRPVPPRVKQLLGLG